MQQSPERFVGIDISKDYLDACCRGQSRSRRRRFRNTPTGHRALLRWIGKAPARACVEASGRYGLDIALALSAAESTQVMVANPRAAGNFREASMRRSKTDALDADVLCEYAQRMPFEPWEPPEEAVRELRAITRRIQALSQKFLRHQRAQERNRLHAHQACREASAIVTNDIEVNIRHLTRRIDELLRQTAKIIDASEELQAAFDHLCSIPGVARKSATLLLGEIALLPGDMSVR